MKAPSRYYQDDGLMKHLVEYIPNNVKNVLIVISSSGYERYHKEIFKVNDQFDVYIYYTNGKNSEVNGNYDCVIGIGGGSVLDIAKYKSYINDECYLILIPTVISSDAACTSMIVPKDYISKDTMMIRMNKNPDVVLVDTEIIKKTSKEFLISGICDASSKYLEAFSSLSVNGSTMSHGDNIPVLSHNIARAMAESLNSDCLEYFINKNESVLDNIIYTCVYLSGLLSDNCGLSLPHAFSLALDECTKSTKLHGEKVALGVLVSSHFVSGFIDYYSFYTNVLGMTFNLKDYDITEYTIDNIINSILSNKLIKNFFNYELNKDNLKEAIFSIEQAKF